MPSFGLDVMYYDTCRTSIYFTSIWQGISIPASPLRSQKHMSRHVMKVPGPGPLLLSVINSNMHHRNLSHYLTTSPVPSPSTHRYQTCQAVPHIPEQKHVTILSSKPGIELNVLLASLAFRGPSSQIISIMSSHLASRSLSPTASHLRTIPQPASAA